MSAPPTRIFSTQSMALLILFGAHAAATTTKWLPFRQGPFCNILSICLERYSAAKGCFFCWHRLASSPQPLNPAPFSRPSPVLFLRESNPRNMCRAYASHRSHGQLNHSPLRHAQKTSRRSRLSNLDCTQGRGPVARTSNEYLTSTAHPPQLGSFHGTR